LVQTGCTAPHFKLEGMGACGRDAAIIAPDALIAPALEDGSVLALEF
jgi:hypothetical protein